MEGQVQGKRSNNKTKTATSASVAHAVVSRKRRRAAAPPQERVQVKVDLDDNAESEHEMEEEPETGTDMVLVNLAEGEDTDVSGAESEVSSDTSSDTGNSESFSEEEWKAADGKAKRQRKRRASKSQGAEETKGAFDGLDVLCLGSFTASGAGSVVDPGLSYVACVQGIPSMPHTPQKAQLMHVLRQLFRAEFSAAVSTDSGRGSQAPCIAYLYLCGAAVERYRLLIDCTSLLLLAEGALKSWEWDAVALKHLLASLTMAVGCAHDACTLAVVDEVVAHLLSLLRAYGSCPCALLSEFVDRDHRPAYCRLDEEEWHDALQLVHALKDRAGDGSFAQRIDELTVQTLQELQLRWGFDRVKADVEMVQVRCFVFFCLSVS